ncbi:MAG: bifunctional nicotinamidase/pyrazinamidase [Planctomycetales bacterium]
MKALIVVDPQNDFLPGGALAVPEGDQVVPVINRLLPRFDLAVATQDWHPADHGSFAANQSGKQPGDVIEWNGLEQMLWPVQCVQETLGTEFSLELDTPFIDKVFVKGTDPAVDSYSGFFDNGQRQATGLEEYLRQQGVEEVCVVGLATDYCVKFTALDAARLGFRVSVVEDACRGVNLQPGDVDRALAEMRDAGITIVREETLAEK